MITAQSILSDNNSGLESFKNPSAKTFSKIVFFDVKDWEKDEINKISKDFDIKLCGEPLKPENASEYADAEVLSTFINSDCSAKVLEKFKNLQLITTRSTGYDHIDLEYCRKKGIQVANVPSYGSNTVAEHAMALVLSLTRRIVESVDRVRRNDFRPDGLTGVDLMGKVMGVIGTGKIGQNVVKYASAFGMEVLAYDLNPKPELAEKLGFTYVELDYLLSKSDVVSLHVPYSPSTHHIINKDNIMKMKKGAYLINTARGGLIETDALFDALRSGHISGAGIDVFEEEKFLTEEAELLHRDSHGDVDFKIALENHMMSYLPNVVVTPHNAFNSKEALQRIISTTVDNIVCYAKGKCENIIK
jgi:D-lactate dehydrogenase